MKRSAALISAKSMLYCICLMMLLVAANRAVADLTFAAEGEHLQRLPKSVVSAWHARDRDAANAIAYDREHACKLAGRPALLAQSTATLWFVTSSCGGSGGEPMSLVLVSKEGSKDVLDEFGSGLYFHDSHNNGLPDVSSLAVDNCCGSSISHYRFDGHAYRKTAGMTEADFEQFARDKPPPEVVAALGDLGGKNCELQSGRLGYDKKSTGKSIVVSSCTHQANHPVWLVSGLSSPARVILRAESQELVDLVYIKPDDLPDVCLRRANNKRRCWHYDGKLYRPHRPAAWITVSTAFGRHLAD